MRYRLESPFDNTQYPDSPEAVPGRDAVRLAVVAFQYAEPQVTLTVRAHFQLPLDVTLRYRDPEEAFVLVVHDAAQRDGFVLRTVNTFIEYPAGERDGPNLRGEPPTPFPGRGSLAAETYGGGWISFRLSFASPRPAMRPSVYLYLVLENYVSNVAALDLPDQRVVYP